MAAWLMIVSAGVSLLVLSVFTGIHGLSAEFYEKKAREKALSVYHETGVIPASAVVTGRTVNVDVSSVPVDYGRRISLDVLQWRRAMVEQALINVCINGQLRCNSKDINLLWAFMPANSGLVSSLLAGESSAVLACAGATDVEYARYSRYLLNNILSAGMLNPVTFEGTTLNFYYSRPKAGEGCSFHEIVELR